MPFFIADISETNYKIAIKLEITNDDGDDFEPPTIVLQVQYPDAYPDEAPILELSAPPNTSPYKYFDLASDKQQLRKILDEAVEENLGMAMIFTVVSTLKEGAEQLIIERQTAAREAHEQEILAAEREENKKFHGTMVTRETFTKWREEFRKEMEESKSAEEDAKEAADKKKGIKDTIRLTGRQLWERGMVGKVDEEDMDEDEDEDLPTEEVEKLKVSA